MVLCCQSTTVISAVTIYMLLKKTLNTFVENLNEEPEGGGLATVACHPFLVKEDDAQGVRKVGEGGRKVCILSTLNAPPASNVILLLIKSWGSVQRNIRSTVGYLKRMMVMSGMV